LPFFSLHSMYCYQSYVTTKTESLVRVLHLVLTENFHQERRKMFPTNLYTQHFLGKNIQQRKHTRTTHHKHITSQRYKSRPHTRNTHITHYTLILMECTQATGGAMKGYTHTLSLPPTLTLFLLVHSVTKLTPRTHPTQHNPNRPDKYIFVLQEPNG
jgi:hypothetical protein